jgi:tetratricopeptide (TPR) repeat protein
VQTTSPTFVAAVALAVVLSSSLASAHETQRRTELFNPGVGYAAEQPGPTADPDAAPPLYDGLGSGMYKVTTVNPGAQAFFDQGLKLAWAFNHAEARRAFRHAQRLDRTCAMCFWGEAFVLGPNINDAMRDEAVAPAFEAIMRAGELADGATEKEQALIEALAARYSAEGQQDRRTLNEAWAEAVGRVAARFPDDANIKVLFADALMNLQPWDYWEADGETPKGRAGEIVATLEQALAINPDMPAAIHLYIHAVEASSTPERAEPFADRLRGAVPTAGHLVHMPAHIYARVGRHADSLAVNRDAISADEAMLEAMGESASPIYRYGYYPHNVHFLMVAAQNSGAAADALSAAAKLDAITSDAVSAELGWIQAIRTAPYAAHAQFSEPEDILALPDPGNRFPFVKGYWLYARGVAFAQLGRHDDAGAVVDVLTKLFETADLDSLEAQYVPARTLLQIATHVVEARIEQSAGDLATAMHHLEQAIALQDSISYMEPPYWYYPVRRTLGATQLMAGRPEAAIASFRAALAEQAKNGWALWGLMQAQLRAGDEEAEQTARQLEAVWVGDRSLLSLDRL